MFVCSKLPCALISLGPAILKSDTSYISASQEEGEKTNKFYEKDFNSTFLVKMKRRETIRRKKMMNVKFHQID